MHAKSGVRQFVEQWLGRSFTDAEKQSFHLRMLVAQLLLEGGHSLHEEFVHIVGVGALAS